MEPSLSLLDSLISAARKAGATEADALLYESSALSVSQRMGEPEGLERAESRGVGLRVFVGQQLATVSSSDTGKEALSEMVTRAVETARLAPADPFTGLAPADRLARDVTALDLYDDNEPAPLWLQERCAEAEDVARATPGITNSEGADGYYSRTHVALAASNGFAQQYRTSYASFSVSVVAGTGTGMERDYDFTSARHVSDLKNVKTIGANAAARALARIGARRPATCKTSIVFDPRVAHSVLGAFAGAINGSAIARGTSFLKDAMQRTVFASGVTIVDEPHRVRGLASRPFDGEGVAGAPLTLVERGTLKSWLLDMRSANKLGLATTGHAVRGLGGSPSPGSSNLYMKPGSISPQALMSDIKSGLYVTDLFGMGVNLVTGDYSQGAAGFWIENGERAYAVNEITIAGKLQDMFAALTPADDLTFTYSINAPTLRIEGMTVAGA